ncbi:MAG: preprotein translocase subunit SecG [Aquabacterium sp.]
MQVWMNLVLVLQMLSAIAMIGLVLLQHGKGADMGASFGSGSSGSLFGASGSANFLSRFTAVCATVFFVCTLALAFMSNAASGSMKRGGGEGASILDRPAGAPAAASAPALGQIPGVAPAPASSAAVAVPVPAPAKPVAAPASAGAIPGK